MKKYLTAFLVLMLAFILCTNTGVYAATKKQKISVYYEKDIKSKYETYYRYKLKSGTPEAKVFFVPNKTVKNFKLVGLEWESTDDNGKNTYKTTVLFKTKKFTPKKPLLADVEMFGTMPRLGISYVDSSGKTRKFVLYQSGKDESVQLSKEEF